MLDSLLQFLTGSNILSTLLGAALALIISVGVSRHEANRQSENKRNNWYRSVHNTLVRLRGGKNTHNRGINESKIKEYSHLYHSFSEQLGNYLPETPTEEVGLELFNSLQNIEVAGIRYSLETNTPNPHRPYLQNRHEDMMEFGLIAQYVIEEEICPDISYIRTLDEEGELEEAEELYQQFSDGNLLE